MKTYDKIILGAGIYGLYSALHCGKKGEKVLVLEYDSAPFERATYINQARVHNGYHYPRSYSTAIKSKNYFDRFNEDYGFAPNDTIAPELRIKIYGYAEKGFALTTTEKFEYKSKKLEKINLLFSEIMFIVSEGHSDNFN